MSDELIETAAVALDAARAVEALAGVIQHERRRGDTYRARALALLKLVRRWEAEAARAWDTHDEVRSFEAAELARATAAEARLTAERETAAGLRALLARYGAHDPDCATEHPRHAEYCTCGFAAALAAHPLDSPAAGEVT